jgi:hypothetical protein
MAQPGQFTPPGDEGWIAREFATLRREMNELRAANPFASMGVKPMPDGLVVEGYETVNGPLVVNGNSAINGTMSINGPLILQPGSIENDSLASPFLTATAWNSVNNYSITTAITTRASVALIVPDGFTQAVVIANASAMGYNNTGTADYLYVQAVVQGIGGGELYSAAGAGLGVGIATPFHTTLTGLTDGQTITVDITTRTSTATWTATVSNQANIFATVLYLR